MKMQREPPVLNILPLLSIDHCYMLSFAFNMANVIALIWFSIAVIYFSILKYRHFDSMPIYRLRDITF